MQQLKIPVTAQVTAKTTEFQWMLLHDLGQQKTRKAFSCAGFETSSDFLGCASGGDRWT